MKHDTVLDALSPYLQAGTFLLAFITFIYSARETSKSAKRQSIQVQRTQVAELLKALGDPDASVRAATVSALAQYPDTGRYVIGLSLGEKSPSVVNAIATVLASTPKPSLDLAAAITRDLFARRLYEACELSTAGLNTEAVADIVGIKKWSLSRYLNTFDGKRAREDAENRHQKAALLGQFSTGKPDNNARKEIIDKIYETENARLNITRIAEHIFSRAAQSHEKICVHNMVLRNANITGLDISNWQFLDCDFEGTLFNSCDAKNTIFERCKLNGCFFRNASLHDARISACELQEADFGTARLKRAQFEDIPNAYKIHMNGAKVEGAGFTHCSLVQASMIGIMGNDATFNHCDLNGAEFTAARTPGIIFRNCSLKGTDLSNANLVKSQFALSQLRGAVLKGTNMSGANFHKTEIADISKADGLRHDGVLIDDDPDAATADLVAALQGKRQSFTP